MESFIETVGSGAIWGLGFGLALGVVRSGGAGLRPLVKGAMKGAVVAGEWVRDATEESRETLQDLYHEAKAERQSGA
jgi:hypothetical protein